MCKGRGKKQKENAGAQCEKRLVQARGTESQAWTGHKTRLTTNSRAHCEIKHIHVGVRRLDDLAEFAELVAHALFGLQALAELREHARGHGNVDLLDVDAGLRAVERKGGGGSGEREGCGTVGEQSVEGYKGTNEPNRRTEAGVKWVTTERM